MDRRIFILISAACIILAASAAAQIIDVLPTDASQKIDPALAERLRAGEEKIPVIVMLSGVGDPNMDDFAVKYRYSLIHGLAGDASSQAIKRIAEIDSVKGIYFDDSAKISAPGNNSSQDQYISPTQIINADKLWEKGIDGRGITVAVLDSGIDKNHPDLIGKVVAEKNFLTDEVTADDLLGHGTMVAGIIAGSGNASKGKYKGIAPGASLLNVKVIDSKGDGKVSDIIAGIEWAIYNGADVLSLSLGGINLGETNPPITMAADNAANNGVVVCVAAGNRNSSENGGQGPGTATLQAGRGKTPVDLSQLGGGSGNKDDVYFFLVPIVLALPPGLIDSPGDGVKVITLGATDANGRMASFSGSGPTRDDRIKPDVVAPGVDIIFPVPPGLEGLNYVDVYYAQESGTSLSTPVAAGLSALLLQANSNLTPAGVKAAITRGAVKLNNTLGEPYEEYYQGAGLLDALRSYQLQDDNIVGVIPDQWNAGRWAYLPSGAGVYVGLNTGADRPQKKLYSLAPGDQDWNTRFVFFSNQGIDDLKISATGEISDWISLQDLPEHIAANDQEVFAASIKVPAGAEPGFYNGSIDVTDAGKKILSIPVSTLVAEQINISKGLARKAGVLDKNQWDYYYLDAEVGTSGLKATLGWNVNSTLDLFLLSPTSEYYIGEPQLLTKKISIEGPPSGRWLLAVHSENSSIPVNYTLYAERSMVETTPRRWNIDSANPGTNASAQFKVENRGPALENLSYTEVIENTTLQEFEGHVGKKETWNKTVIVTEGTKKISAEYSSVGGSNESEVALVFENPEGIGKEENADLGSGDLGPVEINNPELGNWTLKVYGYSVPEEGESFKVILKEYAEAQWSWIETSGPKRIESGSNGTVEANITIPRDPSVQRQDGYIKVSSDNQTFEIPVSVAVAGPKLQGLTSEEVVDSDNDGKFDLLALDFGLNITTPGEYRLEGVLKDCNGSRIELIDQSLRLEKTANISVNISGIDIWRSGTCGPMQIENLILRDKSGNFIDRFEESITVNRDPKEFQAPVAYLTGFVNQTAQDLIAIGVNMSVMKPGSYLLQGTIVDDADNELGTDTIKRDLVPGNTTIVLQFDPSKFVKLDEISRVHLIDLVLSRDGVELERKDVAWTSGDMDSRNFNWGASRIVQSPGSSSDGSLPGGVLKRENGTMVIS
jgi:subtilisin family serine protease